LDLIYPFALEKEATGPRGDSLEDNNLVVAILYFLVKYVFYAAITVYCQLGEILLQDEALNSIILLCRTTISLFSLFGKEFA
jgi:hypothetical protein